MYLDPQNLTGREMTAATLTLEREIVREGEIAGWFGWTSGGRPCRAFFTLSRQPTWLAPVVDLEELALNKKRWVLLENLKVEKMVPNSIDNRGQTQKSKRESSTGERGSMSPYVDELGLH